MAKKKNNDELQPYTEYLEHLSRNHDRSGVFNDFLTMIVCTLSMQQKEEEYLATIRKYTKEEVELFVKAFASLVLWMETHPLEDAFGDYFQQYISKGHNAQFFTPPAVTKMMAAMIGPGEPRDQLRRRGHHGGMLQDDARKRLPERHRRGGLPHGLAPYGDLALLAYRKASGLAPAIYPGAPRRTTGFGTRKRRCESGRRINEIFLLFFHFPLTSRTSFR